MEEKIKTADEMFEELGYKRVDTYTINDGEPTVTYEKENYYIIFELTTKYVGATSSQYCYGDYASVDMEELKAINKKCEELGWL